MCASTSAWRLPQRLLRMGTTSLYFFCDEDRWSMLILCLNCPWPTKLWYSIDCCRNYIVVCKQRKHALRRMNRYCQKKWKHATRCYKMLQRRMLYHVVSQRRYTNFEPIQRQTKALVWLFTLRSCFECWCLTCLALGRGYWNLFCTASIWLCAIVVGTALNAEWFSRNDMDSAIQYSS